MSIATERLMEDEMARSYQIESTMRGTPRGGDWGGPWALHTSLPGKTLPEARQRLREIRNMFTPEVRDHFRLVSVDPERAKRVLSA